MSRARRLGRAGQIRIYFGKCARLYHFEKQWKNLVSTVIIMVLMMIVTGDGMFAHYADTVNGGFAVVCACIWVGLFNSLRSVCRERDVIKREHRTGLHISSYIIAHMLFEAVQSCAEALIVTVAVAVRYADNLPAGGILFPPVLELFLTFFLIVYSSDVLGIMISSIVKSENSAMTVMPFVLIIQMVMSGAVFELEGVTKRISALTISRWGLDAIGSIASKNKDFVREIDQLKQMGQQILVDLDHWDPTAGNMGFLWGILLVFVVVYGFIGIIFLEGIDRDKR